MNHDVSDLYTLAGSGRLIRRPRMPAPHLTVMAHIHTPWMEVDVRSMALDRPLDALFKPTMTYLDLCLTGRTAGDEGRFVDAASPAVFAPLGDCVLVPAGQTFHVRCAPMQRRVVNCMFDPARLDALRDWHWGEPELALCRNLRLPAVRETLQQLASEALAPSFGSELLAESMLLSTLVRLARHFKHHQASRAEPGARLAAWQLRLIRERIETARGPSPGMVELAEACRISPRHLARTFKNSTGSTLGAYMADARIRQAKALLARRGTMVKSIAFDCGFSSAAAFTAAFRKVTGRTPREYRTDTLGMPGSA